MRMNERALQMTVYSSSTINSSSVIVLASLDTQADYVVRFVEH
jgi:hypothetical protein